MRQLFLLSPAKVTGVRAGWLLNPSATFPLARKFQREGVPLAEVFTFASGLYFRGKITYAQKFARPEAGDLVRVITTNAGLVDPRRRITPEELRDFGDVDIAAADPRYHGPLRRDAFALRGQMPGGFRAILLGSIATPKYRDILLECFGEHLVFPGDFVGRGDMSRGGLLLRAAQAGTELAYVSVAGATLRGRRAPRLDPAAPRPPRRHRRRPR